MMTRRKEIVLGGGGHDKENFQSGIIFLGYKSLFPEKWGGGGHMSPAPGSYGTDYQWQKCCLKVRSHLVFFSQIILQRKLWTNWFLATFLAYQLGLNLDEEQKTNLPWNGRSWR